jgi:glycosyltransferase 2 family protein
MVRRVVLALAGLAIGLIFLWLALRGVNWAELESAASQVRYPWLAAAVALYLASIALRCVRWGILLRASAGVKWRHIFEVLLVGFAANYVLPGRIGELFRAEYARRLFHMSRFTSLGTIVVERVCDGVILVVALWIGLGFVLSEFAAFRPALSWMFTVAAASSFIFGAAFLFIVFSRGIDIRRFGAPEALAVRWHHLINGISSVAKGNTLAVITLSLGVWLLEILALGSMVRAFTDPLSAAQLMLLIALGSLSTLVPTAPGYIGTFQFVFAQVFALFGRPSSVGIVISTAMQLFCFGTVTMLGVMVLLSRGGIMMWRAFEFGGAHGSVTPPDEGR